MSCNFTYHYKKHRRTEEEPVACFLVFYCWQKGPLTALFFVCCYIVNGAILKWLNDGFLPVGFDCLLKQTGLNLFVAVLKTDCVLISLLNQAHRRREQGWMSFHHGRSEKSPQIISIYTYCMYKVRVVDLNVISQRTQMHQNVALSWEKIEIF